MQKIEKLIRQTIKNHDLEEKIKKYEALSLWEGIIAKLLPDALGKTMALGVERGILRIAALSREIADLIFAYQSRIIYELNQRLGRQVVFRIFCEV